jgi:hypothetical protein
VVADRGADGLAGRLALPVKAAHVGQQLAGDRAPRGELRRYPASHFEMYHGETFQRVLADQVGFLRAHLLSETADRVPVG